jgi:hypothetical protein
MKKERGWGEVDEKREGVGERLMKKGGGVWGEEMIKGGVACLPVGRERGTFEA